LRVTPAAVLLLLLLLLVSVDAAAER